MASINQKMRNQLKRVLVPALEKNGFVGKFPHFRRVLDNNLHLLSIEFDKWGGGFFLDFGSSECGDRRMSWGEVVPETELTIAHVAADNRARLQSLGGINSGSDDWFRFDEFETRECKELAETVVQFLDQVDMWLVHGEKGQNISSLKPYPVAAREKTTLR